MKTIAIKETSEQIALRLRDDLIASGATVAGVKRAAIRVVKDYLKAEGRGKTRALAILAIHFVNLRLLVADRNGAPSIKGKSYDYRTAIHEVFEKAGVTDSELRLNISAALRHHISERSAELGLIPKSSRQIANETRVIVTPGIPTSDTGEIVSILETMDAKLDDLSEIETATKEQAERLSVLAGEIRRKTRTISNRAARKVA